MLIKKENLPLIIGLSLPVLMVIVLVAVIYIPRLYTKPTYDFIYTVGSYPVYYNSEPQEKIEYMIIDEKLQKDISSLTVMPKYYADYTPNFYRYSVTENRSIPLSDEEVMRLKLDPSKKSPDGFVLNYGVEVDNVFEGIFGEGRDHSQRVLEKGSVSIPISIPSVIGRYSTNVFFVGWIK